MTAADQVLDALAGEAVSEEAPVRVGVVGLGYWGPNLVRNLNESTTAEAAWMCDLRPETLDVLGRRFPAVRQTQDFDEMLEDDEPGCGRRGHPGFHPSRPGDAGASARASTCSSRSHSLPRRTRPST